MRAKTSDSTVPSDACVESAYGETEDYMVNIVTAASTQDAYLNSLEMTVSSLDDNVFKVELPSVEFNKAMVITLHNMLGQKMVKNRVENVNGSYNYTLNLNGLTSGAYLIRLGTSDFGKVKRIIVQ